MLQTLRDAKAYGTDSILVVPGVVSEEVACDVAWERSITQIKKAISGRVEQHAGGWPGRRMAPGRLCSREGDGGVHLDKYPKHNIG